MALYQPTCHYFRLHQCQWLNISVKWLSGRIDPGLHFVLRQPGRVTSAVLVYTWHV